MPDRTHDPERASDSSRETGRDTERVVGGVPREAAHPMYPPYWMQEENMRQGFGGLSDRQRSDDEDYPSRASTRADVQRGLQRGVEHAPHRGRHYGRGPKGYRRSDARLLEEISDRLMAHPDVDASDIEVKVEGGIASLLGTVENRYQKRIAEYVAEDIMGVDDVSNQLKVRHGFWASLSGEHAERQRDRPTDADR
ncbi:MAG: BON domain-containing protein [Gemmatimonadales bacterium]|jgi:hypothetical protein